MTTQNPKSQMLRVPTILIPYVKELSSLHRAGQTHRVVKGLQNLIADIQSCADSSSDSSIDSINDSNNSADSSSDSDIDSINDSNNSADSNLVNPSDINLNQDLIADILKRLDQLESVIRQDQTITVASRTQPVQSQEQSDLMLPSEVTIPASAYTKGLTQYELCDLYDLSYSNLPRSAKKEGLTSREYLYKYLGWHYRKKRYYPLPKSRPLSS